jgi:acyl-coenzyme A thioesterase PaaI-like protein
MAKDLRAATALAPLGDGRFEVDLAEEFSIGGDRPNGGYLLACLGRAAVAAAGEQGASHPHPIATGVQYVRSPSLGRAVVETEVTRVGRSASQVSARLVQDGASASVPNGQHSVAARFTLATLHESTEPYWGAVPPVELPPIEECVALTWPDADRGDSPHPGRPDNGTRIVFDPAAALSVGGEGFGGNGGGELRAWFRFADDRAVDPVELLYVVDSMPPATFTVLSTGWVPTLDLTAYVRAIPAPGPLRLRFRAQVISDGFADEVLEVWDGAGRLVAQSTQLAALRLPT